MLHHDKISKKATGFLLIALHLLYITDRKSFKNAEMVGITKDSAARFLLYE